MKLALVLLSCMLVILLLQESHGYRDEEILMRNLIANLQAKTKEKAKVKSSKQKSSGKSSKESSSKEEGQYDNKLEKPLSSKCNTKKGEAMYKVNSRYNDYRKDRQWKWTCRKAAPKNLDNCKWTSSINDYQEAIRFMCPKNKFISGLKSKHRNKKEDRKWKVLCCEAKGYHTEGCLRTRKLNQYKEAFSYTAENENKDDGVGVFVGMDSEFNGESNDRRWQLTECTLVKDEKKSSKDEKSSSKDGKSKSKSKSKSKDEKSSSKKKKSGKKDAEKEKSKKKDDKSGKKKDSKEKSGKKKEEKSSSKKKEEKPEKPCPMKEPVQQPAPHSAPHTSPHGSQHGSQHASQHAAPHSRCGGCQHRESEARKPVKRCQMRNGAIRTVPSSYPCRRGYNVKHRQ